MRQRGQAFHPCVLIQSEAISSIHQLHGGLVGIALARELLFRVLRQWSTSWLLVLAIAVGFLLLLGLVKADLHVL